MSKQTTKKCSECGDRVDTINIARDGRCHICRCDFDFTGNEDQVAAIGRIGYYAYAKGCREYEASDGRYVDKTKGAPATSEQLAQIEAAK